MHICEKRVSERLWLMVGITQSVLQFYECQHEQPLLDSKEGLLYLMIQALQDGSLGSADRVKCGSYTVNEVVKWLANKTAVLIRPRLIAVDLEGRG